MEIVDSVCKDAVEKFDIIIHISFLSSIYNTKNVKHFFFFLILNNSK